MRQALKSTFVVTLFALPVLCQQTDPRNEPNPIFRVTVVQRTTKAINYQYRAEPTLIDFRGTVLLPKGKGDAIVQSKQGRTEISARFENVEDPGRYGREYLTYVLWALTPDGRPHNLGEVIPGTGDKARLRVTTDYQAFALIVTAEPYSAVRLPSDVVVLENQVRPDTVGKIEEVDAKYDLLPRGQYAWQVPDKLTASVHGAPKVSMHEYEALSELYQAQNAIGIAHTLNAEQYAPNTYAKAQQLYQEAVQLHNSKANSSRVVEIAREAAETAEDARVIAGKREQETKLAQAQLDLAAAQQAKAQAQAEARDAQSQAQAAQAQADAERAAREHAEADAATARERATRAAAEAQTAVNQSNSGRLAERQPHDGAQKSALRMQLLEQLNGPLATRDTPRGLVATIPASGFDGAILNPASGDHVARIASILAAHPGLQIAVEGHSDDAHAAVLSAQHAESVRDILISHGVPSSAVSAHGLGNAHPLASNATAAGREENQRVEIVISGNPIGNIPFWDSGYSLTSREQP